MQMIIAGKKQTNKQTNKKTTTKTGKLNNRGFKNFLEVLPWNQAVTLTNTISAWNFLMEKSGDKISQAYFLAKGPAVYDFDIYFQARGESFSSSTVCKSQTCYTRKLVCQRARDMWLTNLLSCYSFLIVNCVIMIINNKIID